MLNPWRWRDDTARTGGYENTDGSAGAGHESTDGSADENPRGDRPPPAADLSGFEVEAADGSIGTIDEATYDVDNASIVVDTGRWIFGRKVLLPAGTVQHIDHATRRVFVECTKEQIRNSPEYDPETFDTPEYREQVGSYYTDGFHDGRPLP